MIRFSRFSRSLSAIALGLSAFGATSADALASPTNVPFSATVATQEYLQPNFDRNGKCGMLPFAGLSFGTGTASHLGKVAVTATDCVAPVGNQFAFSNGQLNFVAANGDILHAEYAGALVPQQGNVYTINGGTFRIVGGTGRFTGATGGGELRGSEALSMDPQQPSIGQLQAIGTISY